MAVGSKGFQRATKIETNCNIDSQAAFRSFIITYRSVPFGPVRKVIEWIGRRCTGRAMEINVSVETAETVPKEKDVSLLFLLRLQ